MKVSCLAILFSFSSFLFPCSKCTENDKIHSRKESNEKTVFLDKIKVENREAQSAINKLKEDFYNDRESINQKYERKIKDLKKSKRGEVNTLKDKYRNKLKRLRSQYPEIPEISIEAKPKPKPVHPGADHRQLKQRKKRMRIKEQKNKYKDESK